MLKGNVPEKVLKDFIVTYDLEFKDTIFERLQSNVLGPYDEISLKIKNEGPPVTPFQNQYSNAVQQQHSMYKFQSQSLVLFRSPDPELSKRF